MMRRWLRCAFPARKEDERALSRQREQVLKVRKQLEAEGRSLVTFKGLSCPSGWWRGQPAHWQRTVQKHAWPTPVLERLEVYRRLILAAQSEIDVLTLQLEEAAKENLPPSMPELPHGFGELSLESLRREVCCWDRFKNRGGVGSFFGMCAAENSSGPNQVRGSITKRGNARCRHWLIELAWRALQFQPDYRVVKKFKALIDQTKPRSVKRKKLIVAMGRLIGIDLWRLYTGQTTLAKLGLRPRRGKDYLLKS